MRRVAGVILTAYALLISFGSAFALHRWVPLPLAILLVGGVAVLLSLPFCLHLECAKATSVQLICC